MEWASLRLWIDDEEKRIHSCLIQALRQLIASNSVDPEDGELKVSGKLRRHLYKAKKELKLAWTLQCEASTFPEEASPQPFGHPDICFSLNTPQHDQYDYDVECKLVRIKREGKSWDYCQHYVTDGVWRFYDGKYAQSQPLAGAMIGYVQEGDLAELLNLVNQTNHKNGLAEIQPNDSFCPADVTQLIQVLEHTSGDLSLTHLWADVRQSELFI